jgi:hypothetical protein
MLSVSPRLLKDFFAGRCPIIVPEQFGLRFDEQCAPPRLIDVPPSLVCKETEDELNKIETPYVDMALAIGHLFCWYGRGLFITPHSVPLKVNERIDITEETPKNGVTVKVTQIRTSPPYFHREHFLGTLRIMGETAPTSVGPWKVYERNDVCTTLGVGDTQ